MVVVDVLRSVFLCSSNFLTFIFQNIKQRDLSTYFYSVNKPLSADESNQLTLFLVLLNVLIYLSKTM